MSSRLYVVLVNWNSWSDSIECMESLLQSEYPDFVIVLVDNASSDGSLERLRDWADGRHAAPGITGPGADRGESHQGSQPLSHLTVTSAEIELAARTLSHSPPGWPTPSGEVSKDVKLIFVASDRNGGFGAGNNLAFKLIRLRGDAELVWLLNNDTVVTPGTALALAQRVRETGAIVGGTLRYYHERDRVQAYGGSRISRLTGRIRTETRTRPLGIDFVNGACLMLAHNVLNTIGDFDEHIFMYFEDADFCIRARAKGILCTWSDSTVYHKHGATSQKVDDSFAWRQVLRNKVYVLRKNFGWGLWFPIHVASMLLFAMGLTSLPGKAEAAREVLGGWSRELFGVGRAPRDR